MRIGIEVFQPCPCMFHPQLTFAIFFIICLYYIEKMRGIDVNNQLSIYYNYDNRWKVVFFHLLQISLTNAYIIFSGLGIIINHMKNSY